MTDTALTTGTSFRVSPEIAPGAAINRNEPLEVTIDGHLITAYRGDTVTSALLANGRQILAARASSLEGAPKVSIIIASL